MALNYVTREGDTVDLIAWRHYGREDGRIMEQLLEANRGLAGLGAVLPAGISVSLPDLEDPGKVQGVRLWD